MKKLRRFAACLLSTLLLMGLFPAGAAFSQNQNWTESSSAALNYQLQENFPFTAMFYRTTCGNSMTRILLLEDIMDRYDIPVYGVNIDIYSPPQWFWAQIGSYLTLPGIVVTQSSGQYQCFTGADSMRWVMEALYQHLGIYDAATVDFSALNRHLMDNYSQRSSTAHALHLSTDEDTQEVFTGLAYGILDTARAVTEREKAFAIYSWVAANMRYPLSVKGHPENANYSDPVQCYWGKTANSEGFARLTAELCWGAGLPCRVVEGFALGTGYSDGTAEALARYETYCADGDLTSLRTDMASYANHFWNEVYVDGEWIVMDAAFGGNTDFYTDHRYYMRGPVDPGWFDPEPELFDRTHLTWTPCPGDLSLTRSGRSLSVSGCVDETQAAHALLAVYDAGDKMLSCARVDVSGGSFTHTFSRLSAPAYAKLFLLDKGFTSLTQPYTGSLS